MGFSKKTQMEAKEWVITGKIPVRLKPINTKQITKENDDVFEDEEEKCSTPTEKESKIPENPPCPPAPRKKKPLRRKNEDDAARVFFKIPDLETVFKCRF